MFEELFLVGWCERQLIMYLLDIHMYARAGVDGVSYSDFYSL